jgi:Spy/CpxP family protein refolding chaperone
MNRWMQRIVTFASITSALALVPAVASAQDATPPAAQHGQGHHHEGHRKGLMGAALKLDSLTPAQRTQIEQLVAERRASAGPVRQADAQVLQVLAQQVFADKLDTQALAPSLDVERVAAVQEQTVDIVTLTQLHAILTPAQRGELVDKIDARLARAKGHEGRGGERRGQGGKLGLSEQQREQIKTNLQASRTPGARGERGAKMQAALDSFKGDAFNAGTMVHVVAPGERATKMTQAMLPVLTPNQRATYSDMLKHRAEHETRANKKA